MFSTLFAILSKPKYALIVVATALMYVLIQVLIFNARNIIGVFVASSPLSTKLQLVWGFIRSYRLNITLTSGISIIILSILIGVYLTVFVYTRNHLKSCNVKQKVGFVGSFLSIFAAGCLSCLPVVFVSVLGFSTAYALLGVLPLQGLEMNIIAGILLVFAIYWLLKRNKKFIL